ncbi:microtubule associated protein [Pseudozyma hubeiensis SY62]|uniref:Microtubule associated protein n=1 Tax=Pseudozyma hubeiensis (strain SY62) TaxID=1305764 RepID=R9P367_PSEHS|nr:microtubule associated protein [Pseudozyma hubeiensis SY62]GAC95702.1 microtubule associated protein [Pseudozyma hubeiensis SY62]
MHAFPVDPQPSTIGEQSVPAMHANVTLQCDATVVRPRPQPSRSLQRSADIAEMRTFASESNSVQHSVVHMLSPRSYRYEPIEE